MSEVYNAQGRINKLSVLCIDAYGVAVKNGFEGTVEEWLESLKGEDGVDIVSVEQTGVSSADGGDNVITVTLSNGKTSTFVLKNGSKGEQGIQGEKGDTGAAFTYDMFTAEQLAWLVGAKGDKGDKGDPGEKGADGVQGEAGANGLSMFMLEAGDPDGDSMGFLYSQISNGDRPLQKGDLLLSRDNGRVYQITQFLDTTLVAKYTGATLKGVAGNAIYSSSFEFEGDEPIIANSAIDTGGRIIQLNDFVVTNDGRLYKVTFVYSNAVKMQYTGIEMSGGGSGADLLNENGVIKQEHLPEGFPYPSEGVKVILPETTPTFNEDMGGFMIMSGIDASMLIESESYTINWNGTDYTSTAMLMIDNGVNAIVLGDMGAMEGTPTTGEPFVIIILDAEGQASMGMAAMIMPIDGSASVTLSISCGESATPIAHELLPKGYPYSVEGGTVILEETTLAPLGIQEATSVRFKLVDGHTYKVVFDGTPYTVKSYKICYTGGLFQFIGNPCLVQETYVDNNIPFAFLAEGGAVYFVGYNNNSATVSITEEKSYEKIDTNYLPLETVFVDVYGEIGTSTTEGNITSQSHETAEIISLAARGKNVILRNYISEASTSYYSYYLIGFNGTQAQFSRTRTESGRINGETITVRPGKIEIVTASLT